MTDSVPPSEPPTLVGETSDAPEPTFGTGERSLALVMMVGGVVGLAASFALTVERFALAADPDYLPSCDINPLLSCGSVMSAPQAGVFGFPNPLLGLVGFTVVVVTGVLLIGRVRLPGWYWAGLQAGATFGIVFVHWLAFQSIYRIGALCPYCMVVWVVVIPIFWSVTIRNIEAAGRRATGALAGRVARVRAWQSLVLTAWYLMFVVAIAVRFRSSWSLL